MPDPCGEVARALFAQAKFAQAKGGEAAYRSLLLRGVRENAARLQIRRARARCRCALVGVPIRYMAAP